jgi:hypothetical protein
MSCNVQQPLLNIHTPLNSQTFATGTGKIATDHCCASSPKRHRFIDRQGRFRQSLGRYKCVIVLLCLFKKRLILL